MKKGSMHAHDRSIYNGDTLQLRSSIQELTITAFNRIPYQVI
jgi:hypothetical protein